MERSFRVLWEIDIDAPDATSAAKQARDSIVNGTARVFEVHEWDEPDMITATPVALIDLDDPDADLPAPNHRIFRDQYLGPTIV
jgi:hypothetical protein